MVSELETTVRRQVAPGASVTAVEGAAQEAMEEVVALVEVRKFPQALPVLCFIFNLKPSTFLYRTLQSHSLQMALFIATPAKLLSVL